MRSKETDVYTTHIIRFYHKQLAADYPNAGRSKCCI